MNLSFLGADTGRGEGGIYKYPSIEGLVTGYALTTKGLVPA